MTNSLNIGDIRDSLLAWFDAHRRDLPWRYMPEETPDPYRVWLSEVMLQQTRVETVKPYFRRWLERFPTLASLAEAPLDEVLKAWEGLGYYSRARNFHAAVREVATTYGGAVPSDPVAFRALPGVGEYTLGAVMSIAFGRPAAAVDGNVRRVFSRLLDDPAPSPQLCRWLAESLADGPRPGDLNQSLMELGATICTPRRPACETCPLQDFCASRAAGTQALRPSPKRRGPLPIEEHGVAVLEQDGRFLLVRRPIEGRLGGMWEFPARISATGEEVEDAVRRAAQETLGRPVAVDAKLGSVRHDFSHVRVQYHAYSVRAVPAPSPDAAPDSETSRWLRLDEFGTVALPTAQQKITRLIPTYAGSTSSP